MRGKNKRISKNSLVARLAITFSIVIALSLLITGIFTYKVSKDRVTTEFKNSATQVGKQTSNYIEAVLTTVDAMYANLYANNTFVSILNQKEIKQDQLADNREVISNILTNEAISNSFNIVSGITFYSEDGLTASFPKVSRTTDEAKNLASNIKNEPWYNTVINNDGKPYWLPSHEEKIVEGRPDTFLSSISLIKDERGKKNLGIIKIDIKAEVINQILRGVSVGNDGYVFITEPNGIMVANKDKTLVGNEILDEISKAMIDNENREFTFTDNNKKMHASYIDSTYNDWRYVAVVPQKELLATANHIGKSIVIIGIVCLLVCIYISFMTAIKITTPIQDIIGVTNELSSGNFAVNIKKYNIAEIDTLSNNFNNMIKELNNLMRTSKGLAIDTEDSSTNLVNIIEELNQGSKEVASAIEKITEGSTEQALNTSECIKISDKLDSEINSVVQQMNSVSNQSNECIEIVEKNKVIINELVGTSETNYSKISIVSDKIHMLESDTTNLLTILERIDNITTETNLLSLNASIEAARSGEAGKGFAVVAGEIRKLSEQTKEASIEIESIIERINNKVKDTVIISTEAKESVLSEREQVSKTVESFDSIKTVITNVIDLINESMECVDRMQGAKDNLSNNIQEITDVSQDNAAATEEVMATVMTQEGYNNNMLDMAYNLKNKSDKLKELLMNITIKEEEPTDEK